MYDVCLTIWSKLLVVVLQWIVCFFHSVICIFLYNLSMLTPMCSLLVMKYQNSWQSKAATDLQQYTDWLKHKHHCNIMVTMQNSGRLHHVGTTSRLNHLMNEWEIKNKQSTAVRSRHIKTHNITLTNSKAQNSILRSSQSNYCRTPHENILQIFRYESGAFYDVTWWILSAALLYIGR